MLSVGHDVKEHALETQGHTSVRRTFFLSEMQAAQVLTSSVRCRYSREPGVARRTSNSVDKLASHANKDAKEYIKQE